MSALLTTVARDERGPSTLDEVFERCQRVPPDPPFFRAAAVASTVDRLAWVFTAAYHGALRQLFGDDATIDGRAGLRRALCVTEEGGNTPRAIETSYTGGMVNGAKSFVTFGNSAESLIVLANRGTQDDGRKDLVLVRVMAADATLEGDAIQTPFLPEIPHARVTFDESPGTLMFEDAWPRVKAFRFVEDLFVLGSTLAWFCGQIARAKDPDRFGRFARLLAACESLAEADPASHAAHLAYAAVLDEFEEAVKNFSWANVGDSEMEERWVRDRPILRIASKARQARRAIARDRMRL